MINPAFKWAVWDVDAAKEFVRTFSFASASTVADRCEACKGTAFIVIPV